MACNKISNILLRSVFCSIIIVIITIFVLLGFVIISSAINYSSDKKTQIARLDNLRIDPGFAVTEQDFASFDLDSINPKLNQLRTIITHNSYKNLMPPINHSIARVYNTIAGINTEGQYSHNTLYEQLNSGIRGFEMDIRYHKDGFRVFHAPIVDKRTNSPDWKLALEEMYIWSNNNSNHIPITVLIEVKNDPRILNPTYIQMEKEQLELLDESILDVMGEEKVLTPQDLMGNYDNMYEMVENNGWPTLNDTKGKFIFLLHPHDNCTDTYIDRDTSLSTQVMVPVISYDNLDNYNDYACIIMHNEPDVDIIQELVSNNYIVRTRMDKGIEYDETRTTNALLSQAQLLTTDFAKNRLYPTDNYIAYIVDEFTISLNANIN